MTAQGLPEPTTVAEALADVCRRSCLTTDPEHGIVQHDPVCAILTDAMALRRPRDGKLGGQRQGGMVTARTAAELVAPRAGTQRARVLDALTYRLRDGSVAREVNRSDVELQRVTGLAANSVRPRRVELVDAGWVRDSGERVVHNGREHVRWTLTRAARERLEGDPAWTR